MAHSVLKLSDLLPLSQTVANRVSVVTADGFIASHFVWEQDRFQSAVTTLVLNKDSLLLNAPALKRFAVTHKAAAADIEDWQPWKLSEGTSAPVNADFVNVSKGQTTAEIVWHAFSRLAFTKALAESRGKKDEPIMEADCVAIVRCPNDMMLAWLNSVLEAAK